MPPTNPFSKYSLRDNPFGVTPTPDVGVWADRTRLKKEIETLLANLLASSPSRLAACYYGDWGAGKTHMASYFSSKTFLKTFAESLDVREPYAIRLITPARDMIDSIYFSVIDLIGVSFLKKTVDSIEGKRLISVDERLKKLQPIVQDENLAVAFLGKEQLLSAYLYQSATSRELRQLGLPRGITTDLDKLKTLRAVFNLLAESYSRVIMWLDDVERIREISGRDLSEFQIFLRDLLEYVPTNLNIILLFTLSPGEKVEDTITYLGDALRSRLYTSVQVPDMTKTDFVEYVKDLLAYYRTLDGKKVNEVFPFVNESTLEHVYDRMREKDTIMKREGKGSLSIIPRNINMICSQLLEKGLRSSKLETIDVSMVDRVVSNLNR